MFPKRAALHPLTLQISKESLARFKAMNSVPLESRVEAGDLGNEQNHSTFNLFSNSYNGNFGR